jgi:hypothetical protein
MLVLTRRYPMTLIDPVEEPLSPIAGAIEVVTETDRLAAIALRRDVGP